LSTTLVSNSDFLEGLVVDTSSFRLSTNIEYDCLGDRAGSKDRHFDAVQQCYSEVGQFRTTGTASNDSNDMGVVAIRNGILHNLEVGNIDSVENFLRNPTLANIPSGGEELSRTGEYGWPPQTQKTDGGSHLNPALAEAFTGFEKEMKSFMHPFQDSTPEHKAELVHQATDFLKSPSGNDLVIKYDGANGPS